MRTLLLFCTLCAALLTTPAYVSAQSEAPEKDVVVVDFFARDRTVPAPYVEAMRRQVIDGFLRRGRQVVIDAQNDPELSRIPYSYGQIDPLKAAQQQSEFMQQRMEMVGERGARYLVSGVIPAYKFEHIVLRTGKQGFRSTFALIITGYDMKLGKEITPEQYTLTAEAPVADDADMMAVSQLALKLSFYVDYHYPFETSILGLGGVDRKGVLKELYIHSGSDIGVETGDLFMVYEEVPMGGEFIRERVGKLRVNQVTDRAAAKCKVVKGGEQIADAFSKGRGLICVSDGKAFF